VSTGFGLVGLLFVGFTVGFAAGVSLASWEIAIPASIATAVVGASSASMITGASGGGGGGAMIGSVGAGAAVVVVVVVVDFTITMMTTPTAIPATAIAATSLPRLCAGSGLGGGGCCCPVADENVVTA
jgi:hypothetical protein